MSPLRIVEALDEVEHGHLRFGLRPEPLPVEELALERGEEALTERVVVGIAYGAHRGPHAHLLAAEAEGDGRILLDATLGQVALLPAQRSPS